MTTSASTDLDTVLARLHPTVREGFIPITDRAAIAAALLADRPRAESALRDIARACLDAATAQPAESESA